MTWLTSDANDRPRSRLQALFSYFEFLRKLDAGQEPEVQKSAARALVGRILHSDNVGSEIKSDLAAAAALVFVKNPGYIPDWDLLDMAASTFWDGYQTDVGELPQAGSLKYRLYFTRFYISAGDKQVPTNAVGIASKALAGRLLSARLQAKTVYELGRLLYSYCEEHEYLEPPDTLRFVRTVLAAVNSGERRQQLSMELGSLSGDILYRNMKRDKVVGRQYADLIIDWYGRYAAHDWYSPKFLVEAAGDFPELKGTIETMLKAKYR